MASTVENINSNIENAFSILNELYIATNSDSSELQELRRNYTAATCSILSDYFTASSHVDKTRAHNNYVAAYYSINLVNSLQRIFKKLSTYNISHPGFSLFPKIVIDETFKQTSSDVCKACNILYDIEERDASFTCKNCGGTERLVGVVFEDDQFYYQEGQRTKHGKYDPIKHAKFHVDHILAKETTEIPDKVIDAVKLCIKQDKLWLSNVDCATIRSYLKKNRMSLYNNHVALIRKIITGVEPPHLTDHEINLVYLHFSNVIQIFNKIKPAEKSNCPYHPFFIYKIIEQILRKKSDDERRKQILSSIHLQSRDTLIENDKVWFEICTHIPEFTRISTDRNI